eukprot:scaffold233_cov81-Cylindrotheca_fusiformis.AAC.4
MFRAQPRDHASILSKNLGKFGLGVFSQDSQSTCWKVAMLWRAYRNLTTYYYIPQQNGGGATAAAAVSKCCFCLLSDHITYTKYNTMLAAATKINGGDWWESLSDHIYMLYYIYGLHFCVKVATRGTPRVTLKPFLVNMC